MDLNRPEITYILLIIPLFFAIAVIAQGAGKILKAQSDGPVITGFGLFILVLVAATYFFFIR